MKTKTIRLWTGLGALVAASVWLSTGPMAGDSTDRVPNRQVVDEQSIPEADMPTPASARPASFASVRPSATLAVPDAAKAYAAAQLYASCEQRAKDPGYNSNTPDEAYEIDPTGALAARLMRDRNASDAECRLIGPTEYRQVDELLQAAASRGNRDAQGLLLRRRAQTLMDRALRSDGSSDEPELGPVDEAEAKAIVSGLEGLALDGHRASMVALDQLLSTSQPPLADPTRAAAWRLVSYQVPGQPFPQEAELPGSAEVLDDMDDASRQETVALARSLFDRCCSR